MTAVEFSLIAALGFGNTSCPAQVPTLFPSLLIKHELAPHAYFADTTSARCLPQSFNRWNPVTATWDVRAGYDNGKVDIYLGHASGHSVGIGGNRLDGLTESLDYVGVRYRLQFQQESGHD